MRARLTLSIAFLCSLPSAVLALTLAQSPLFVASTEQRVMLVISRDHQLSMKAYTDYSNLDDDPALETTYDDGFSYYGYFDSNKCYQYSSNRFAPSGPVQAGTHQCGGGWSGNFLNWATMTRMDILRKTLYGGRRSTDTSPSTSGASYETVLERHFLPVDVHAFVKVYAPTSSMPTIQSLTGLSGLSAISLCNVSDTTSTTLTGKMTSIPDPLIKVAKGAWPQWDSSEVTQCGVRNRSTDDPKTWPVKDDLVSTSPYIARVQVCVPDKQEDNCKTYRHPTTGVETVKPVGLLQRYGDVDAVRRVRFGLMTGSYDKNKSGGVLRKNAQFLANNNKYEVTASTICGDNNDDDEIDVCTGRFINQDSAQAGIINTLNRLRIAGFQYTSGGGNGSHQYGCNSPGLLIFDDGKCVDWGNPLSETYLETLRYFARPGGATTAATTAFDASDANILASIPKVSWKDPLPETEWCALSSIIVLSTGLNSFDTDTLDPFSTSGGAQISAASLTDTVGANENINGKTYLIGQVGSTGDKQCTAKAVTSLSAAKGICPEVPSIEGGYGIAGLAYAPKTIDFRPAYKSQRETRWGTTNINKDWAARQPISTYAVQLAESLPSFSIPVGTGAVTLLPACKAQKPGKDWRNCSMTNLIVDANVPKADVGTDTTAKLKTCSGNGTTSGCFTVAWEDSTWGNDYDMDGIERLGYCVGAACNDFKMVCPTSASPNATIGEWSDVAAGQIRIATCAVQAVAGHALTFGYTITGTGPTTDGASFPILRPGSNDFTVGAKLPSGVTPPQSKRFAVDTTGASAAQLLENPLWYAAKYGGFIESNPTAGTPKPDVDSEWDKMNNWTGVTNKDGVPDNYFSVRNPATLITALSAVFDKASEPDASASSVATNSTSLKIESRVFQAKFSSADWSGQLLSYNLNVDDPLRPMTPEWDAGQKINAQTPSSRVVLTKGATDGVAFSYGNLTGPSTTVGTQQYYLDNLPSPFTTLLEKDDCGRERVDYLRGDPINEDTGGAFTCASGSYVSKFRQRKTSKLGDIVNSSPWYVGPPAAGFSDVKHKGYTAFRRDKLSRKPVVYVGSNDGMLHGFDASLTFTTEHPEGLPAATAGKEVIAYIPSVVFPNLSRLTAQTYNKHHRYFVDGTPMTADADLGSSTSPDWRTVLVGATAAGGRGYYALDVTDPGTFSESRAAQILLWEFNDAHDPDMGYVYNMPPLSSATHQAKQIVKMANGKWAVILGNGYNSTAEKAALYILFIKEGIDGSWTAGSDYVKIVAYDPKDQSKPIANGLSTPVPVDSNNDGFVDTVYAGDLGGNLWKFLVGPNGSDATVTKETSTWKVAFSGAACGTAAPSTCKPLFTATDGATTPATQPIIWPPEVTAHPKGGQLVLFGTGKYIEPADNTSSSVQTFYGVWDKNDGSTRIGRRSDDLLEQKVDTTTTKTGGNFREISGKEVVWREGGGTGGVLGWFIDLPTARERTTGIPKLENKVIFFNTFIPSTSLCDPGTGWLMALDFASGGQVKTHQVFDTNYDKKIDELDTKVGGYQIGAVPGGTTLIAPQSITSDLGVGVSSLTTGNLTSTLINFGASERGRLNWREIVQ